MRKTPLVKTEGFISLVKSPGMLEGPLAEKTIGEIHLEIFVKVGMRNRFDPEKHPKLLREAADRRPRNAPNPCLVPLDEDEHGNAYVYGRVTVKGGHA